MAGKIEIMFGILYQSNKMMKHVPDKFKKLTIVIPTPTDERAVALCPGIGPGPKPGRHRSS